jgi:hypothetical protein
MSLTVSAIGLACELLFINAILGQYQLSHSHVGRLQAGEPRSNRLCLKLILQRGQFFQGGVCVRAQKKPSAWIFNILE